MGIDLKLLIVAGATVALCLGKAAWGEWVALVAGLLGGFGVAKAAPGSASSDPVIRAIIPLALVGALLSGCVCATPRACLGACLKLSGTASEVAIPIITADCKVKVAKCGAVPPEQCPAYGQCVKLLDSWRVGMAGARKILDGLNDELATAGVK